MAWPILKNRIFLQATEIFLRLLNGETISIEDVTSIELVRSLFYKDDDWQKLVETYKKENSVSREVRKIKIPSVWHFDKIGVVPFEAPLEYLRLTIGAHWTEAYQLANRYRPCGVFNLSITPNKMIEVTHEKMEKIYHKDGGPWHRSLMPRTVLVFISDDPRKSVEGNNEVAKAQAHEAHQTYWNAMWGTIDPVRLAQSVDNALTGHPEPSLSRFDIVFTRKIALCCGLILIIIIMRRFAWL